MLIVFKVRLKGGISMRVRSLFIAVAVVIVAMVAAGPARAQARGQAKTDNTNPRTARFGVWDNSTNPNNVMTYEGYEKDGSKLTVSNPSDPSRDWSYVTMFDGVYRPVQGQDGAETAVERSEERRVGKECRSRWAAEDKKEKEKKGRENR